MSNRFPDSFVTDLVSRTDLVALIERHVPLKKRGNEYHACCPFHEEKSPSFTVSPQKGFYHCFGCPAHGNAINFLMEHERMQFPEAVRHLAELNGVPLPEQNDARADLGEVDKEAVKALRIINELYVESLAKNPALQRELSEHWGVNQDLIKELGVGYAPPRYRLPNVSKEALELAHLVDKRSGGPKVFDCLTVPLTNTSGTVVGFSAVRRPTANDPREVKMGLATAAHNCFGYQRLRSRANEISHAFVVPRVGEMLRALALGVDAVAPAGAELNQQQAIKLIRITKSIVASFPGNAVGRDLAIKVGLDVAGIRSKADHGVLRVFLTPPGVDFPGFVKAINRDDLGRVVENCPPMLDYLMEELRARYDLSTPGGREKCWARAMQILDSIQEDDFAHLVIANEIQRSLTVPYSDAMRHIKQQAIDDVAAGLSADEWQLEEPGRRVLRAVLSDPSLADDARVQEVLSHSSTPAARLAKWAIEGIKSGKEPRVLIESSPAADLLARIARMTEMSQSYSPEESLCAVPFGVAPAALVDDEPVAGAEPNKTVEPEVAKVVDPSVMDDLPEGTPRRQMGRFFRKARIR